MPGHGPRSGRAFNWTIADKKARQPPGARCYAGAMDLSTFDFNQPANVLWWAAPLLSHAAIFEGETRHFDSVTKAIRFVMEELTDSFPQSTAWIQTDAGPIELEQIRQLYSELGK
jgi:hypothetical protein